MVGVHWSASWPVFSIRGLDHASLGTAVAFRASKFTGLVLHYRASMDGESVNDKAYVPALCKHRRGSWNLTGCLPVLWKAWKERSGIVHTICHYGGYA